MVVDEEDIENEDGVLEEEEDRCGGEVDFAEEGMRRAEAGLGEEGVEDSVER